MNAIRSLIMEDDDTLREVLRQFLSIYFSVDVSSDLNSARQLISEKPYDLLILDKSLPDGSGLELLQEVRSSGIGPAVIIMTSDGDMESIRKALALGADDYVVKSEQLVQHLLVRIPIALKNSEKRARFQELVARADIRIPDRAEDFGIKSYQMCLESADREYIRAALKVFGSVSVTAEKLGVSRSTLFRKISELGVGD